MKEKMRVHMIPEARLFFEEFTHDRAADLYNVFW